MRVFLFQVLDNAIRAMIVWTKWECELMWVRFEQDMAIHQTDGREMSLLRDRICLTVFFNIELIKSNTQIAYLELTNHYIKDSAASEYMSSLKIFSRPFYI